jgi:hypothetical protein
MDRGPAVERSERLPGRFPEWDQLGVLDPPAARELLDDQLGIEEHRHLAGTQLAGQGKGPDDPGVFRDVVRLDAEVVRDRGVGRSPRVGGVRPRGIDEDGPGRGGTRVAASRAVGPDDQLEPLPGVAGGPRGFRPERRAALAVVAGVAQSRSPSWPVDRGNGGGPAAPVPAAPVAAEPSPSDRPRSLRQAIWIGS